MAESPQFVNSNHEAIEEQPLPPRRSARKRPAPGGARRAGPSKRAREQEPEEPEEKEETEQKEEVKSEETQQQDIVSPPRPARRQESHRREPTPAPITTGAARSDRQRTLDNVRAHRESTRRQDETEEKNQAQQQRPQEQVQINIVVQQEKKRKAISWCRIFFVSVWCIIWVGSAILDLAPDRLKAERTYQSWVLSELRGRQEWKFLETHRINITELSTDLGEAERIEAKLKKVAKIVKEREERVADLISKQAKIHVDEIPKYSAEPAFVAAKAASTATRELSTKIHSMHSISKPQVSDQKSVAMQLEQLEQEIDSAEARLISAVDKSKNTSFLSYYAEYEAKLKSIVDAALLAAQEAAVDARTLVNAAQSVSHPEQPLDARAVSDFVFAKLDAALRAEEGFDFASMRTGAHIIALNTSRDYASTLPWNRRRSGKYGQPASVVLNTPGGGGGLDKGHHLPVGHCFAFSGTKGQLAIQLAVPVIPTKFVLEHAAAAMANSSVFGHTTSAPANFSLIGYPTHQLRQTPSYSLGSFIFQNPLSSHRQVFELEKSPVDLSALVLQVHSNHGHPDYTCIYRVAVYATS
mmetsp:Transcript_8442/g.12896  ORF Transcript_8442/g.12896 Transcript_8442/m.12896 type:complete len:583 (-) Transcript_8442:257-2005(-)